MRNIQSYDKFYLAPYNEPAHDRPTDLSEEDLNKLDLIWDDRYDDLLETVGFTSGPDGIFNEQYDQLLSNKRVYDLELRRDAEKIKLDFIQRLKSLSQSQNQDNNNNNNVSMVDDEFTAKTVVNYDFEYIKANTKYLEAIETLKMKYSYLIKDNKISQNKLDNAVKILDSSTDNKLIDDVSKLMEKETAYAYNLTEYESRIQKIYDEAEIKIMILEAQVRREYIDAYEGQNNIKLKFHYQGDLNNSSSTDPDDEDDPNNIILDPELEPEPEQTTTTTTMEQDYQNFVNQQNGINNMPVLEPLRNPATDEKMSNDHIIYANLKQNSNPLLLKARAKVEGVHIYNTNDEKKPLSLLKKQGTDKNKYGDYYKGHCKFDVRATKIKDVGYEGATVLEPYQGFHKKPVPTLDYNALYPNIMRGRNMSHETKLTIEDIIKHGYIEGEDYEVVLKGRKTVDYKYPLCHKCTENLALYRKLGKEGYKLATNGEDFKCCELEKELKKSDIKKNNWRENDEHRPTGQYLRIVVEEYKVFFARRMCKECFDCKECEQVREREFKQFDLDQDDDHNGENSNHDHSEYEHCESDCKGHSSKRKHYCAKHIVCPNVVKANERLQSYLDECLVQHTLDQVLVNRSLIPEPKTPKQIELYQAYLIDNELKCPKYRRKAILCEVITRLLNARSAAKKIMAKWEDIKKDLINEYLTICGLPLNTKEANMPKPKSNALNELWIKHKKMDLDMEKLLAVYAKLKEAKDMEALYNQWQAAFKVTCNSVYGFTGAKQGFLPDMDIAGSVTCTSIHTIYIFIFLFFF